MQILKTLFPYPLFASFVVFFWLLRYKIELIHVIILLGFVIGISIIFKRLPKPICRIKSYRKLLLLICYAIVDIVISNLYFFYCLVSFKFLLNRSQFLAVRLEIPNPISTVVLAFILAASPGLLWVAYDTSVQGLLVHIYYLEKTQSAKVYKKLRLYQEYLKEIFE